MERVERKYGLRLPRSVVTVDYGVDVGDLFVRFRFAEHVEGEPSEDGRVIMHYDEMGSIAAIEIRDITVF